MINKILLLILSFVMVVACNKSPLISESKFDDEHKPLLDLPTTSSGVTNPTVTINQDSSQSDPVGSLPISFEVIFSEAIDATSFTSSDITQSGSASGITWTITDSGDHMHFTLTATAVFVDGTLIPSLNPMAVLTSAGGSNSSSTSTDNSVTYGSTLVAIVLDQAGSQVDPINSLPIEFDVTFSEAIDPTTFTTADITQNGTATGITWTITHVSANTTFTLRATALTGAGSIRPSIAAGTITSALAKSNSASASTDDSVTYESTAPTVTVNQTAGQVDPINALPIEFDIVFSEPIVPATFTTADITQNGTATGITWTITHVSANTTFTLKATAITGAGTVRPSIAASSVTDLAGNNNTVSTATDNTVTYDITAPDVTVNQGASQTDPINALPIEFDVVFSEPIVPATFTAADITQNGTATGVTWTVTHVSANTTFTVKATVVTGAGTLRPSIAASRVTDVAGNNNTVSTATDNTVTYDITAPDVTVNQGASQADPINALPIEFDVVFSEPIVPATFTAADITQNGTATGVTWTVTHVSANTTFTVKATVVTGAGTLRPSIAASRVTDVAGNNNTVSTATDNTVTYDLTAPDVTVNQGASQADPINALPIEFDVVFSEPIAPATFTAADITQNGTATGVTWTVTHVSANTTFTVKATVVTVAGTLRPSIAASSLTDVAGNNNTVSTATDNTVTYEITVPTVTVNQKAAQSDPTAVLPIEFDVVFSEAIDTSTFTTADITQNGTAATITWGITNPSADNRNFVLTASAASMTGTLVPSIAASAIQDPAGNNNTASTNTDATVNYTPFVGWAKVSTGGNHSCGLTQLGLVYCWGRNNVGQVGDNTIIDKTRPTLVDTFNLAPGETFTDIDSGSQSSFPHTCGITNHGNAYCWGNNGVGQVGDNSTTTPRSRPTAVNTAVTPLAAGEKFVSISAGGYHTCALSSIGKIYCWGSDTYGQIGDGASALSKTVPREVDVSGIGLGAGELFTSLALGSDHSCGLTNLGRTFCWGRNNFGQLGDNTSGAGTDKTIPTLIDSTNLNATNQYFVSIHAGPHLNCGITNQGNAYCWGANGTGQLGDFTLIQKDRPVAVNVALMPANEKFISIEGGFLTSCGLTNAGKIYCFGSGGSRPSTAALTTALYPNEKFIQLSVNFDHRCGLTTAGNIYCFGANTNSRLGDGTTSTRNSPYPLSLSGFTYAESFKNVSTGANHSCGLSSYGNAFCWGLNTNGQLGNNSITQSDLPVALDITNLATTEQFKHLVTGGSHSCGLTGEGNVFCWGSNSNGQLGDNTTGTDRLRPTAIYMTDLNATNERFISITAGTSHTCGITNQMNTYCWGIGASGQLGDNTATQRTKPTAVDMTNPNVAYERFTQLSAGGTHTCGKTSRSNVYCWGTNTDGRIGDNTNTQRDRPTVVSSAEKFMSVSAGLTHSCGITSSFSPFCWGNNANGRLGDNSIIQKDLPTSVSGSLSLLNISASNHTCGKTSAGNTYCWGINTYGQLGENSTNQSLVPIAVSTVNFSAGEKIDRVFTGGDHSCGATTIGKIFCWGLNSDGQVGDNTGSDSHVPIQVDTSIF